MLIFWLSVGFRVEVGLRVEFRVQCSKLFWISNIRTGPDNLLLMSGISCSSEVSEDNMC